MKTPTQSSDLDDLISARGAGGEVHQHVQDGSERLTTAQSVVIADNLNSLRVGAPGPTLLEDLALREKIFHFDHERIPERVVHARGYGGPVSGDKSRLRPESFSDHYSQARQFYISQTPSEQGHIAAALVFELSKCAEPGIRARIVSHLRNIDEDLAALVGDGLGLEAMPAPAPAARPTRTDLKLSPALSIQSNPPKSFKGRVMGVMLSGGFDGSLLAALEKAVAEAGGLIKIIAPRIGGATCSKNNPHAVDEKIGGAPSVLFDAVAILPEKAVWPRPRPQRHFSRMPISAANMWVGPKRRVRWKRFAVWPGQRTMFFAR